MASYQISPFTPGLGDCGVSPSLAVVREQGASVSGDARGSILRDAIHASPPSRTRSAVDREHVASSKPSRDFRIVSAYSRRMQKWGIVTVAIVVGACGRSQKAAPVAIVDAGSVVTADTAQSGAVDAGPRELVFELHGASFVKDRLSECIDSRMHVRVPDDAGVNWAPKKDPTEAAFKELKMTRLNKSCGDQFSDRTALAVCVISNAHDPDADGGSANTNVRVEMTDAYFDYQAVVEDDAYMKQCLDMGGDWKALSRDSDEFRRAKLEHDTANLRKLTGKISGMGP